MTWFVFMAGVMLLLNMRVMAGLFLVLAGMFG